MGKKGSQPPIKSPNEWRDDWSNLSDEDKANIYEDRRIYNHYNYANNYEEKLEEMEIKRFYAGVESEQFTEEDDATFLDALECSLSLLDGTNKFHSDDDTNDYFDDQCIDGEEDED